MLPADTGAGRRLRVVAASLRPSELVYQTMLDRDTVSTPLGTRTVSVTSATYAGVPAWLMVETRTSETISAADSLYASFLSLSPLHWSASIGSARLATEFRGDTAFGGTSAPSGRRSIVTSMPSGTLVSGAMLETVLRLLPLQLAWEDSANILSVSVSGNSVLPARVSVIGEDHVRVPAGEFDCWVVSVRADPARGLYWVTKQDPIVVRSAVDVPGLGSAQLVSALERIAR